MSYVAGINWSPPSVYEFVVTWLRGMDGIDPNGVGLDRPSGAVLPYRMVNRPTGTDDKITESSIVSIHTFADNMDDAEAESQATHRRMLQLGPPLAPQQQVTIPSTGLVVVADSVTTKLLPTWVDYQDNTIRRFAARYEIDLRFVSA